MVDDDVNAEVSQYLQLIHISFAHQRRESVLLCSSWNRLSTWLYCNLRNNTIQDSGFHRFVAISAYSRPTTCEIQEISNYLCIIMGECGFLHKGYYVSLPGTVLDQLEEAEEGQKVVFELE